MVPVDGKTKQDTVFSMITPDKFSLLNLGSALEVAVDEPVDLDYLDEIRRDLDSLAGI